MILKCLKFKKLKLLIIIFIFPNIVFAQEKMEKVPKVKSFELGYRYITSSSYDAEPKMGATILFDYAWQLSGFTDNKKAAYISVPLGYTYLINSNDTLSKNTRILSYGWTVKHDLSKNKKLIPYLGYGLLLNQLKLDGVDGTSMGHQTRFDFGVDLMTDSKITYFAKAEYSMTRYPTLGDKKTKMVSAVEIKVGVRF